jgi:phage terminase small subunit
MVKPGRVSAAELAFPSIDAGAGRPLAPPAELTSAERKIFAEIVSTVKVGHFRPSDAPLVGLYVQALTLARSTGSAMEANPADPSPSLIRAYDAATRRVTSLATKLRLTPISRAPQKSGATNDAARAASYYDYLNAIGDGATDKGWRP